MCILKLDVSLAQSHSLIPIHANVRNSDAVTHRTKGIIHHYVARHASKKIESEKVEMLTDREAYVKRKRSLKLWRESVHAVHAVAGAPKQNSVDEGQAAPSNESELCTIHWIVRDLSLANFLLPFVDDLLSLQAGDDPLVKLKIHFTGGGCTKCGTSGAPCFCGNRGGGGAKIDSMAFNALLLYHFGQSAQSGSALEVQLGRPDFFRELGPQNNPSSAFYCGGPGLKARLDSVCESLNLPFHPEEFQNRTLSEWTLPFGKKGV